MTIEFENRSYGNRSGFVHETKLFVNNELFCKSKTQYINRTWERYLYQTSMQKTIEKALKLSKSAELTEYLTKKYNEL